MKTVFAVLTDWVCDDGDNGSNVFLFDNLDKARKHLRGEAISELDNRRNDVIYYDKDTRLIKGLLKEAGDDFEIADETYTADYVIEASLDYFCCYKAGEYLYDRITVSVIKRSVE